MEESVPRISQDNAVANKHQETQIEKKRKLVSKRQREKERKRESKIEIIGGGNVYLAKTEAATERNCWLTTVACGQANVNIC